MELRAAKKQEQENQFHRLPDDVVLDIFDKISDIQWLCRCFLVSKHFSHIISRVQTVSVKRISFECGSKDPPPLNFPGFQLLCVFTQIRSLNLEIASHFKGFNSSSAFKWGANFTPKHHGVTLLYAESLSKMKEKEEETEHVITRKWLNRGIKLAHECMSYAGVWLATLSCILTQHPTLESFTITDPNEKGVKLCLRGEKLAEFRVSFHWDRVLLLVKSWMLEMLENMTVGYLPVLQLPVSAYVMKGVIIVNFKQNGGDDSEADSAMLDAFVEEQGVFSEAVERILKNHKDAFDYYDPVDD